MQHAELLMTQRLVWSLKSLKVLEKFGDERDGQVSCLLHIDERPSDLNQASIVKSLLDAPTGEQILFKPENEREEELVLLVGAQKAIFDEHDKDLTHGQEVALVYLEVARIKRCHHIVEEHFHFLRLKE